MAPRMVEANPQQKGQNFPGGKNYLTLRGRRSPVVLERDWAAVQEQERRIIRTAFCLGTGRSWWEMNLFT